VDSGLPPSGLDILLGVCKSMSSAVELPESSLDDCGASFSDVIVCSFTVILLINVEHSGPAVTKKAGKVIISLLLYKSMVS
jgi:hypothetical protein